MLTISSAYWIDVKSKLHGTSTSSVEGILTDAKNQGGKLVVFIVYDLPNRDCHAKASNGEICCNYNTDKTCDYSATGDCSAGINEYKTTYIDPLYEVLDAFDESVPIVLIIEPDSLPNLATNLADAHCGNSATQAAYLTGFLRHHKTEYSEAHVIFGCCSWRLAWMGRQLPKICHHCEKFEC